MYTENDRMGFVCECIARPARVITCIMQFSSNLPMDHISRHSSHVSAPDTHALGRTVLCKDDKERAEVWRSHGNHVKVSAACKEPCLVRATNGLPESDRRTDHLPFARNAVWV